MSPTSYQTAPPRVASDVLAKAPSQSSCPGNRVSTPPATLPDAHPTGGAPQIDQGAHPPLSLSISALRTAVVDIGTNSTRLLIADVDTGRRVQRSCATRSVTRLGDGVDAGGELSEEAMSACKPRLPTFARDDRPTATGCRGQPGRDDLGRPRRSQRTHSSPSTYAPRTASTRAC